ncbi:MAG: YfhO family protein, partial [Lachnospiraceae bacterium]|nr:YfhO family protein [Lachnospiraceae bacterium]
YILTVAVSAMSNFYFFYVLVCILVIYALIRSICLYQKSIKKILFLIARIGMASFLGLMLSAVIFLPMCYAFLIDTRGASAQPLHLFYPLSYYLSLPAAFLSTNVSYELFMGFSAPILPAVFFLFYKRRNFTFIKILFSICIIILLFPFCGQVLNGFSYMTNRWCFAFALVTSYILTCTWTNLMHLKTKEIFYLILCTTVYFLICLLFEPSRTKQIFSAITLCMIMLVILFPAFEEEALLSYKRKQQFVLLIVLVSVILNSFWKNSVSEGNDAQGMGRAIVEMLTSNETALVAATAEADEIDSFYRYSGRDLTANANMISGISSTQYYWTISNPYAAEYRSKLNLSENTAHRYTGYDDRTALNALASVLYYSVPVNDSMPVPYGFSYAADGGGYKLYRNNYVLPFSYAYDSYILEDIWAGYSSIDKQNAMLQSVVLSKDAEYSAEGAPELNSQDISYTITCNSDEVTQQGNSFVTTAPNASVTISFEGIPYSETYLEIIVLDFQGSSEYDLYFGDRVKDPLDLYDQTHWDSLSKSSRELIKKERWLWTAPTFIDLTFTGSDNVLKALRYYTRDHSYYAKRHDFAVNLGYSEDTFSSITITFSERGVYTFDSLQVISQPMAAYQEQIAELKENTLENITFGADVITGEITLDTPKILCFSIPYSTGWHAYVDGKEEELQQANIMHMAVDLSAGTHMIELVYKTPLAAAGLYLSLGGGVIFIVLIIVNERRKRGR